METSIPVLSKELTMLVQHIELNRSGWQDKTIQKLVIGMVWLTDCPPCVEKIQDILKQECFLTLGLDKINSVLSGLIKDKLLIRLPDGTYRIPDSQRKKFEQEIKKIERVEREAREVFFTMAEELRLGLDIQSLWSLFETKFLTPLIKEVGASTFELIMGKEIPMDKNLIERFLSNFRQESRPYIKNLVTDYLDSKKEKVRAHISRMLHARFCVEACGLPEAIIQKVNETVGKQTVFRILVDTNFLFSLLELHENPSNDAARVLLKLISQLKSNIRVELLILPRTIVEAKSSIISAKERILGIPVGNNFTKAAIEYGFSGMIQKYFLENQRRGGKLTVGEWFEPYLRDIVAIARGKGIEIIDENIDPYSIRQDVIDDILNVMEFEKKYDENKRKSYKKVEHDMILWHFVKDRRDGYIESPIDARDWILTVDYRFIGFDEFKQKQSHTGVPLCLHPTSLIQFLQFWVPRTKEFDEAMLGSMRLPFLFQEFDADGENISLKILKGVGRFNGRDDLPANTITRIILNEGLRSRLQSEPPKDAEAEIVLIRDALIEESNARAEAEASKVLQLKGELQVTEVKLNTITSQQINQGKEIAELKKRIVDGESQVATLNEENIRLKNVAAHADEVEKQRHATVHYLGLLVIIIAISIGAGWVSSHLFSTWAKIFGPLVIEIFIAILFFIASHLLLEFGIRKNQSMISIWPLRIITKFRKWLWTIVVSGLVIGVISGLYVYRVQNNLNGIFKSPLKASQGLDEQQRKK